MTGGSTPSSPSSSAPTPTGIHIIASAAEPVTPSVGRQMPAAEALVEPGGMMYITAIGEWIGSSMGFIVVMLSAMFASVGLVGYAVFAALRGTAPAPAPQAAPSVVADRPGTPAWAPVAARLTDVQTAVE
jgi:hypothetical protein